MEIQRSTYEALIEPLLDRTMECVKRALEDAKLAPGQIDKVVLVGGSTRTPLVSMLLEDRLRQQAHQEVNPELCVAMGASLQAGIIAGENVGAVLVDITPHTLGVKAFSVIEGMEDPDHFAPIIQRNTSLPASRSDLFYTMADNQSEVEVDIYQGESSNVHHNARVGKFLVQGLAPVPAGNVILVQLDLNLDGVLRVTAKERATGLQKQVTIENALAKFQHDERAAARGRLEELWEVAETADSAAGASADEDEPGDAWEEMSELAPVQPDTRRETVQARALLEKAQRLLATVPAEDRPELERLMAGLNLALTEGDAERRHEASDRLADVLFYIEDVG